MSFINCYILVWENAKTRSEVHFSRTGYLQISRHMKHLGPASKCFTNFFTNDISRNHCHVVLNFHICQTLLISLCTLISVISKYHLIHSEIWLFTYSMLEMQKYKEKMMRLFSWLEYLLDLSCFMINANYPCLSSSILRISCVSYANAMRVQFFYLCAT